MRPFNTLALLLGATLAAARIANMSAPATVYAGRNFTAVVYTEGYIQNNVDFGLMWGLKLPSITDCDGCIGELLSYNDLYSNPNFPQLDGNATFQVPVPSGYPNGTYTLVMASPNLVGASGETEIRYWNQTVTVAS